MIYNPVWNSFKKIKRLTENIKNKKNPPNKHWEDKKKYKKKLEQQR